GEDGDVLTARRVSVTFNSDAVADQADNTSAAGEQSFLFGAVGNSAPIAHADSYQVGTAGLLDILAAAGVLANDLDADADPFHAILVNAPAHGQLSFNADGSFRYIADPSFGGVDQFVYRATDGEGDSDLMTVSLAVRGPVLSPARVVPPAPEPAALPPVAGTGEPALPASG